MLGVLIMNVDEVFTLYVLVDGVLCLISAFSLFFIRRFLRRSTSLNFMSCSMHEMGTPTLKVYFASIHVIQTDGSQSVVTQFALAIAK